MKAIVNNHQKVAEVIDPHLQKEGPVITISRSYGCDELPLIDSLIPRLNKLSENGSKPQKWRYVSNLIFKETAKKLHLEPYDIETRVMEHKGFSEWSRKFDRERALDRTITKTIEKLMMKYAHEGKVIFLGRGSKSLLHHIPNSLHLRLTAPLDFRKAQVANKMHIGLQEAEDMIRSIDRRRVTWTEHLVDEPFDESDFDLTLNTQSLANEEMIEIILHLMQCRELLA